ncbi:hypothetical protein EM595_2102 [Duffyella gerundensis]|uniref:Secreted protein n=1 Tax=Duffyella gerundensis TaxID=1619313 RepID=A0A0U5L592_9GAMM|nr:hypothetical protein [Duffyella gerundensis]CUU24336.1 hypothetical protein EM595_2102 [Duffyella gerundensis]
MDIDKLSETIARIQFVADVSLVAQCKSDELKMALSMISDMAGTIETAALQSKIFYQVE